MAKKTTKKRVTRKQLLKKPDEFLTFSARALQFTLGHKTQVTWGIGGLFGIFIIFTAVG